MHCVKQIVEKINVCDQQRGFSYEIKSVVTCIILNNTRLAMHLHYCDKLSVQRNETVTKQFQNSFETVLKQNAPAVTKFTQF